jgi:hypothetical protein
VLRDEWLEKSELSPEIIRLDSLSIVIRCQLDKLPFDTFYNPIVCVNIMSALFTHDFLKDMPLALTTKLLKSLSGRIVPSLGILCALPIFVNGTRVPLNFYSFDVVEFDVLIGQPTERLIQEGQTRKLNIKLWKNFELSMPITRYLNTKIEPLLESDPIEEVKVASLDDPIEPNIEDDAQPLIDEEGDDPVPYPLDEMLESPNPSIELKPRPSGLRYAFLNNDQDSPMIISNRLSQEESLGLITILEKHRSAFSYSLQDLKGISPVLCTHRIPIDLDCTPSRELQHRLNNVMKEVVKKEVLKLLHAGIIYPMPHSEWVSPVQVVPKKGGMTVVKNKKNKLIPKELSLDGVCV